MNEYGISEFLHFCPQTLTIYCSSEIAAIKKIDKLWTTSSLKVRSTREEKQMRGALELPGLLPEAHAPAL